MNSENIKSKVVHIELFDGTPKGMRQIWSDVEVIEAIVVPRNNTAEVNSLITKNTLAVYLLLGENEAGKPMIYVGQTKRTKLRALEHNKKRDWWNEIIYFINRAGGFSSDDLNYLEWFLIKKLSEAKRVELDNSNKASADEPASTRDKKANFSRYYNQIVSLTEIIGLDIFNKIYDKTSCEPVFYCKNTKGANASAYYREDGFYVQKRSECVVDLTVSGKKSSYIGPIRERLLSEGVLKKSNGQLIFIEEYKFNTPSGASQIILGTNSNGWVAWKDAAGKTLDECFRQEEKGE